MGSSMMKTTLREIRQSLGRYLAIMAIVALGVGLFCGLKVTRDVMVKSAQQYFEERQLYDISLLSTVGFDTDVAKQLSRREKVLDAQGAVSTDALLLDAQGKESALKVYSLLDQQNLPVLVSGRMPKMRRSVSSMRRRLARMRSGRCLPCRKITRRTPRNYLPTSSFMWWER